MDSIEARHSPFGESGGDIMGALEFMQAGGTLRKPVTGSSNCRRPNGPKTDTRLYSVVTRTRGKSVCRRRLDKT